MTPNFRTQSRPQIPSPEPSRNSRLGPCPAQAPFSGSPMGTPTDTEVVSAATTIRSQNPSLGLTKLLAQIKAQNPEWSLSEKVPPSHNNHPANPPQRLKKLLSGQAIFTSSSKATSRPLPDLQLPPSVRVTVHPETGKGLVAAKKLRAGETVWKEGPLVWALPLDVFRLGRREFCAYCGKVFQGNTGFSLRVESRECQQRTPLNKPPTFRDAAIMIILPFVSSCSVPLLL
jgi:hypothetical protein